MRCYEFTMKIEIPEKFGEFQEIEAKVQEASRKAGQALLGQMMIDYEEKAVESKETQKKDRRGKTYETLLGKIHLNRRRVTKEGKTFYPIDLWLGLSAHQGVSPGLKEEIVHHCVNKPYEKASQDASRVTGERRSAPANWKLIQREAAEKKRQQRENSWRQKGLPILRPGVPDFCPMIGIDPDATYIRSRKKEDKKHEIKMAVLYTKKSPVAKAKGKLRWELGQKQVVLAPLNSSSEALFDRVTDKGVKDYGVHTGTRVIAHGDGDPWIKQLGDYFPQTLLRLDPYHAFKKMREACDIEEIPGDWIEDFYRQPERLIEKLEEFQKQLADSDDRERVDGLMTYFENNLEGMKPSGVPKEEKQKHPRMYLRGSGGIESNIDWAIGARFKRSRMMWSESGGDNLLFLRMNYLNGITGFRKASVPAEHYRPDPMEEMRQAVRDL